MVANFEYKNLAPLFVGEECSICVKKVEGVAGRERWDVWITGRDGGLAVRGKAVIGALDGHLREEEMR